MLQSGTMQGPRRRTTSNTIPSFLSRFLDTSIRRDAARVVNENCPQQHIQNRSNIAGYAVLSICDRKLLSPNQILDHESALDHTLSRPGLPDSIQMIGTAQIIREPVRGWHMGKDT